MLKEPLGVLLPDSEATKSRIKDEIPPGSYVITVGDHTTEKMMRLGMIPSLQITDGLERRHHRPHPRLAEELHDTKTTDKNGTCRDDEHPLQKTVIFEVTNPPAEITPESIDAIQRAFLAEPPVRIRVRGEEDLLVVPVCIYAPDNSVVLYGQPNEGLVITAVTDAVRNKTRGILGLMGGT